MYLILESPLKLLKAGEFSASNVMVGVTRDDGDIFSRISQVRVQFPWRSVRRKVLKTDSVNQLTLICEPFVLAGSVFYDYT